MVARYTVGLHCQDANEPAFAAGLEQVRAKTAEVVRQIDNVMSDAGYADGAAQADRLLELAIDGFRP